MVTLEDRIAKLESENAWLRAQLRERFDANAIIGPALKLTPMQGCIILLLYEARGRVLSRYFLDAQLPLAKNKERVDTQAIDVQISHMRKRLGRSVIENVWGHGFRLSEEGRRIVGEALGACH